MKIISFSFAGGSKYSFQKLHQKNPNIVVIEYPGRGKRINEKLINNIDLLIEDLLLKVIPEINSCSNYVIYGHSMGALIGYLICHKIMELDFKKPNRLVISGKTAPSIKNNISFSQLPDTLFWQEIIKIGGIPEEIHNIPELLKFFIPILKADFRIIEQYEYQKKAKLNIPIDVFYGTKEEMTLNEREGWKNESTETVSVKLLEGNHFFIYDNEEFFINYFENLSTM